MFSILWAMLQWMPFLIYAGFIFYLSSLPTVDIPGTGFMLVFDPEKLVLHFFEYLPLGFLAARATLKTSKLSNFDPFIFPALLGSLYGLSDEIHQFFVPGRTVSVLDVLANSLGATCGAFLWGKIIRH